MDFSKEKLSKLISRLVVLGEDKDELELWLAIFDNLPEAKRKELIINLEEEIKALDK